MKGSIPPDFRENQKRSRLRSSLAWPDHFLGAGRNRLQYKRPHLGAGAYTASDNALRLKSGLAMRD